ncbi:hypothetical protein VTK73DRAFT_8558 [Phialemonium thermophilum]|uniref:Uncharacterized protein n=1 Tax=Phialemonium thermophilum TaxID=223376 RepID=A0ABR3XNK3_9PEZI
MDCLVELEDCKIHTKYSGSWSLGFGDKCQEEAPSNTGGKFMICALSLTLVEWVSNVCDHPVIPCTDSQCQNSPNSQEDQYPNNYGRILWWKEKETNWVITR